jgi:hypothetical protein
VTIRELAVKPASSIAVACTVFVAGVAGTAHVLVNGGELTWTQVAPFVRKSTLVTLPLVLPAIAAIGIIDPVTAMVLFVGCTSSIVGATPTVRVIGSEVALTGNTDEPLVTHAVAEAVRVYFPAGTLLQMRL